jgi:hypothetical protein
MRVFALAVFAVFCAAPLAVYADGDKQLQSVKGSVSYQHGKGTRQLARSATIVLTDKDFAITGDASLAAVVLPDSSRVTMGSLTRVQMAYFTQLEGTTAKFVLYGGKTRFKIEHPNGKPANYTFQTPTAQIAVRGTEGDIGVDGRDLVVNVYGLTNPALPVIVTTEDGKKYVLRAGQQLLANWVNGHIQTTVGALTDQAVAQFEEIGAPASNWAAAVQNLPQTVVDNAASQVPIVGGLLPHISFGRHSSSASQSTPNPSPSPCVTAPPGKTNIFGKLLGSAPTPAPCVSPSPSPKPS